MIEIFNKRLTKKKNYYLVIQNKVHLWFLNEIGIAKKKTMKIKMQFISIAIATTPYECCCNFIFVCEMLSYISKEKSSSPCTIHQKTSNVQLIRFFYYYIN